MEVKRGRREIGDRDTYDFKLQCSGVWQSYLGMKFSGHQEEQRQACACHVHTMCMPCACHLHAMRMPCACHVHVHVHAVCIVSIDIRRGAGRCGHAVGTQCTCSGHAVHMQSTCSAHAVHMQCILCTAVGTECTVECATPRPHQASCHAPRHATCQATTPVRHPAAAGVLCTYP